MGKYVLKKVLLMLPTLLVVYSILFFLKQQAPGDPVAVYRHQEEIYATKGTLQDKLSADFQYKNTARFLGEDLPVFYFSIVPSYFPDTLYKIVRKDHRVMLTSLLNHYGNWENIEQYYQQINLLENRYFELNDSIKIKYNSVYWSNLQKLYVASDATQQNQIITNIAELVSDQAQLLENTRNLRAAYEKVIHTAQEKSWIPKVIWNGMDNQFQFGLSKVLKFDFGNSYTDNRAVNSKILDYLKWTLLLNFLAILLIFGLAIPLGVYLSIHESSWKEKIISSFTFGLYAMPLFWVATMLIHIFATDSYHLNFFPASGVGDPFTKGWAAFGDTLWHLILPLLCLVYHDIAYITMQMKGAMLEVYQQDYIKLAIAKGLPKKKVIWKHAFRNALFPIITHFSALFPAMITGSIIVENIFGIPGMGDLSVKSILNQDWPVVSCIVFITAILTMIGMLAADLLMAKLNPRINLNK